MAFKSKTKNRLLVDERQTLDAKHNNILQTFTDKTKNDLVFYYTYTINNKYGTGNIHAIIVEMYCPLTQQGSFAISNNNNHVGIIVYADGDFTYLSPKNKVYMNIKYV